MTAIIVNSDLSLQSALGLIRELYEAHKYVKINTKTGTARSLDQNAISHAWYGQLGRELREYTALEWKCYCKLHHGVPIMRFYDESFRTAYDSAIKGLSYEQKLKVMRILPVTSLMTKAQLSEYLEQVQVDFRNNHKVFLEFPQEAV